MGLALQSPVFVVDLLEVETRLAQFLDALEVRHPEQILLERADETLGQAATVRRIFGECEALEMDTRRDLAGIERMMRVRFQ